MKILQVNNMLGLAIQQQGEPLFDTSGAYHMCRSDYKGVFANERKIINVAYKSKGILYAIDS